MEVPRTRYMRDSGVPLPIRVLDVTKCRWDRPYPTAASSLSSTRNVYLKNDDIVIRKHKIHQTTSTHKWRWHTGYPDSM